MLEIDTSLDPAISLKSKINKTTAKKAGWSFIDGEWVHKTDEYEAQVASAVDDAPEGPPAITIESMYQTMTSRFDNMEAYLRRSHEESTTMIHRLDDCLTSLEQEMCAVWGHLLPPTL
ncbi:hypothetical protein V6N13_064409 [Hibiscus sabdariffa]